VKLDLRHVSLTLFVLTVAFMIPFEYTITRILGVACLIGFVVTGLFAIANPAFLARREDDADDAADAADAG
jgi:hypothetical protein